MSVISVVPFVSIGRSPEWESDGDAGGYGGSFRGACKDGSVLSMRVPCRALVSSLSTRMRRNRAWAAQEEDEGIIAPASLYASEALRMSARTVLLLPSPPFLPNLRSSYTQISGSIGGKKKRVSYLQKHDCAIGRHGSNRLLAVLLRR